MTIDELKVYYADLLIIQYKDKPNAYATIKALVELVIMDFLPILVQDCFNIDTAIGKQLDILGNYQAIDRYSKGPNGPYTLTDDEFRNLIKMAIVKNSSSSSLEVLVKLLYSFFPTQIQVFDTLDMKIHYIVDILSSNLLYAFINEVLLPKPMGVQIAAILYVDNIDKVFGHSTYMGPAYRSVGLNSYTAYDSTTEFLTYADNII